MPWLILTLASPFFAPVLHALAVEAAARLTMACGPFWRI